MMSMSMTGANAGVNIFLALNDRDFQAGLKDASGRIAAFATKCNGLATQIGVVAQSINVGLTAAVRKFAEFDTQMRAVAGVSGATGAGLRELSDAAKQIGRETSFTETEAAGGMLSLARMGFDPREIGNSIRPVMDLAKATGTDLAQASEIAGNALRVFGMETSETTTVADLLATVANRSAQTLADVGEALKTAGPHAARAGESLQDTAAAIGVLANMGIRGSMAGNAIGRTLKQIADPQVAAKLAEMGVATTGADGNLRKLKDVLVDIARVSSTMKSGEQIAFFEDIFNARGSLAGGTLAANLPAMERMGDTLAHSGGEAHRLAQEMDSGIGGALTRLSSAANGLASDFGKALSPLAKLAAGAATAALGALSKAATALGGTFSYLAVVAVGIPSAFGGIVTAGGLLARMVLGLHKSWGALGQVMKLTSGTIAGAFSKIGPSVASALTNPWVLGITAIAAAATAVTLAVRNSRQELEKFVASGKELREKADETVKEGNARRATDFAAWEAANAPDADETAAAEIRARLAERYGAAAVKDSTGVALRKALLDDAIREAREEKNAIEARRISIKTTGAPLTAEVRKELEALDGQFDSLTRRLMQLEGDRAGFNRTFDISAAIEKPAKSMEELAEAAGKSAEEIAKAREEMAKLEAEEFSSGESADEKRLREIGQLYRRYTDLWETAGHSGQWAKFTDSLTKRYNEIVANSWKGHDGDALERARAEADRAADDRRLDSGLGALADAGDSRGLSSLARFFDNRASQLNSALEALKAQFKSAGSESGVLLSAGEKDTVARYERAIEEAVVKSASIRERISDAASNGMAAARRSIGAYAAGPYFRNAGLAGGSAEERTAKATEAARDDIRQILEKIRNAQPLLLS